LFMINNKKIFFQSKLTPWLSTFATVGRTTLFLAAIWWLWRQRSMVVYAEHYAGDGWLLRKIYEMEDDCVNFLACRLAVTALQKFKDW